MTMEIPSTAPLKNRAITDNQNMSGQSENNHADSESENRQKQFLPRRPVQRKSGRPHHGQGGTDGRCGP